MHRAVIVLSIVLGTSAAADAADLAGRARDFLSEHCFVCHDADTKKGGLDLTALAWKPDDARTFDRWVEVFDKVDKQKMPPPSRKRPDPAARARFLEALRTELRAANLARQQAEGRVVLRRLNRVEYENTLHDLLAIDVPLQHYLPEDATTHGFDNVAAGLAAFDAPHGAIPGSRRCRDLGGHGLPPAAGGHPQATAIPRRGERPGRRQEEGEEDLSRVAGRGRHLRRQFAHGAPPVDRADSRTIPDSDFRLARTRRPDGRSG